MNTNKPVTVGVVLGIFMAFVGIVAIGGFGFYFLNAVSNAWSH